MCVNDKWFYLLLATVYSLLTVSHVNFVVFPKTYMCNNHGNHIRAIVLKLLNKIYTNSHKEASVDMYNVYLIII
jgi:hypothetical protein